MWIAWFAARIQDALKEALLRYIEPKKVCSLQKTGWYKIPMKHTWDDTCSSSLFTLVVPKP